MYKAHSKDINRNKSFHPLTFGNLSKVERIKEKDAAKKEEQEKRQQELRNDQEERRYNELISAGAGADGGSRHLPVKRVFAAEYEKEEAQETARHASGNGATATATALSSSSSSSPQASKMSGFMAKFHCEPAKREGGEEQNGNGPSSGVEGVGSAHHHHYAKRERDTEGDSSHHHADGKAARTEEEGKSTTITTGYVTTSEAAKLRKEYELLKKQKVDPLRKVQAHQSRTVAAAAAAKQRQSEHQAHGGESSEESAIRDRIRKMMEMSKKR